MNFVSFKKLKTLKYNENKNNNRFGGVPIAMGKKSLLQNVGSSIDDHPYIQFYVDMECIVFCPKIDKKCKNFHLRFCFMM